MEEKLPADLRRKQTCPSGVGELASLQSFKLLKFNYRNDSVP